MSTSDYLENIIINHILRNQAFTPPSTIYVGLHTADPGETGGSEVTGGSYARQAVTLAAASGGVATNSGALTFSSMPACTVTHVSIYDASTSGNLLYTGALTASKSVPAGDAFQIAAGDLSVTIT